MRVSTELRLCLTAELYVLGNDGGVSEMNDWAKVWAGKIKQRTDDRTLTNATVVEEQNLKDAIGPPLWASVCDEVKANCEALNNEMNDSILAYEFIPHGDISVVANLDGKTNELRAAFDVGTGILNWDAAGRKDSVILTISKNRTGATFVPTFVRGAPSTPESIARQMLDSLLDGSPIPSGLF